MSGAVMNQMQRDSVKNVIIGFKTDTIEGKHDANLHTDHLEPGRYIAEKQVISLYELHVRQILTAYTDI
jgi:hypothetical protein